MAKKLVLGPNAYRVAIEARHVWLGLKPGRRAVFDPDAGTPAPGELVALIFHRRAEEPFIARLAREPRPAHWAPSKVAIGARVDRQDGTVAEYFERGILRVDKFVRFA